MCVIHFGGAMKSIKILLLLLFLITLSACNRGDTYNPEINGVPPV